MCCTCMGERRESGLCIRSHAQRVLVRVRVSVRVLVPVRRKYPGRASVCCQVRGKVQHQHVGRDVCTHACFSVRLCMTDVCIYINIYI